MILETNRLILRELTSDDYDALYAVLADSDIMEHYSYIFDETRVRSWITRNIERYKKDGFGLWAVVLKESGEGRIGLNNKIHSIAYKNWDKFAYEFWRAECLVSGLLD